MLKKIWNKLFGGAKVIPFDQYVRESGWHEKFILEAEQRALAKIAEHVNLTEKTVLECSNKIAAATRIMEKTPDILNHEKRLRIEALKRVYVRIKALEGLAANTSEGRKDHAKKMHEVDKALRLLESGMAVATQLTDLNNDVEHLQYKANGLSGEFIRYEENLRKMICEAEKTHAIPQRMASLETRITMLEQEKNRVSAVAAPYTIHDRLLHIDAK